jgi:hypothetical protein
VFNLNNAVFKQTCENEVLMKILAMIVQIGNYLNYGTPKGNCKAFKIGLLSNLSQVKSLKGPGADINKKMSMLEFILQSLSPPSEYDETNVDGIDII